MSYAVSTLAALIATLFLLQLVFIIFADRTASAAANSGATQASLYGSSIDLGRSEAQRAVESLPGLVSAEVSATRVGDSVRVVVTGNSIQLLPFTFEVNAVAVRELSENRWADYAQQ